MARGAAGNLTGGMAGIEPWDGGCFLAGIVASIDNPHTSFLPLLYLKQNHCNEGNTTLLSCSLRRSGLILCFADVSYFIVLVLLPMYLLSLLLYSKTQHTA